MPAKRKETLIDPRAMIDIGAELDSDVSVGPFSVIGPEVKIGAGTVIGPHVVLEGRTTIGRNNRIFQYSSVGAEPQDLKYGGEDSELVIGDDNIIRECATINKGTEGGGMVTRLGSGILVMAYSHIAHDCQIGDGVIIANAVNIGGHVVVENNAVLGGLTGIHQFCRVGSIAMVGAQSYLSMDVAPYTTVQGTRAKLSGLNVIGLKRNGFSDETTAVLKSAFKTIFKSSLTLEKAVEKIAENGPASPEVDHFVDFIRSSERGVIR